MRERVDFILSAIDLGLVNGDTPLEALAEAIASYARVYLEIDPSDSKQQAGPHKPGAFPGRLSSQEERSVEGPGPVYGIWVGDKERPSYSNWHYGSSKVFATENPNLAFAQLHCCKRLYMGLDCDISVFVIGPDGLPMGSPVETQSSSKNEQVKTYSFLWEHESVPIQAVDLKEACDLMLKQAERDEVELDLSFTGKLDYEVLIVDTGNYVNLYEGARDHSLLEYVK